MAFRRRKTPDKKIPDKAELNGLAEAGQEVSSQSLGLGDQVTELDKRVTKTEEVLEDHSSKLDDLDALLNEAEAPVEKSDGDSAIEVSATVDPLATDSLVSTEAEEASEIMEHDEAIIESYDQAQESLDALREAPPEDRGEKAGEISQEGKNEIEESFGDIVEVTRDEEGNVMSDVDNYENEETGRSGVDALYEDLLEAESIKDPVEKEKAVAEVKKKIEDAVGDKDKAEKIYDKASEDKNMMKYHNALFMEKLKIIYQMEDPKAQIAADKTLQGDMSPIEKLKKLDEIIEEASVEHEELRRLNGLSKKIDKKIGVPSLIDAYGEVEAKGIKSKTLDRAIQDLDEALNSQFELTTKEGKEAATSVKKMVDRGAGEIANEILANGSVRYTRAGKMEGVIKGQTVYIDTSWNEIVVYMKDNRDNRFNVNMQSGQVEEDYDRVKGAVDASNIGATEFVESEKLRSMAMDFENDNQFMDKDQSDMYKEMIGIAYGVTGSTVEIPSNGRAQLDKIHMFSHGSGEPSVVAKELFGWMRKHASSASEMRKLRANMKEGFVEELVSLWTEKENGELKSQPVFEDYSISDIQTEITKKNSYA